MNFLPNNALIRVAGAAAGATTEVDGSAIDMAGYESASFVASLATLANGAVATLTAQGRNDPAQSWADLAATVSHRSTGSEVWRLLALEIIRPSYRYLRVRLTRGVANTAVDSIVAFVAAEGQLPVTQGDGVDVNTVLSPEPA